jgi:uncharacterized protein (TIGR02246 family)
LVTAAFLTAARPAGAATLSKEDDAGVRKVAADFEKSWNTHDMKLLATLFHADAEFINIVGMHWHGREAIVAAFTGFHETIFKNHHMTTDAIEIRPIGNGFAIAVLTTGQDSFTTPDGHVMPKEQTRETLVMAKGADGWKIVHGHNVAINAEAAKNDPANAGRK